MKSIVTEYEQYSVFSGTPTTTRHHCVFGRGLRKLADEDGLWIPVTDAEHNMSPNGTINQIHDNPAAEKLSKIAGQLAWEKEFYRSRWYNGGVGDRAREAFRKRYGQSFL